MNDCMREDAIRFCKLINHNASEEDIELYIKFFCDRCKNLGCKSPNLKLRKIYKDQDARMKRMSDI